MIKLREIIGNGTELVMKRLIILLVAVINAFVFTGGIKRML